MNTLFNKFLINLTVLAFALQLNSCCFFIKNSWRTKEVTFDSDKYPISFTLSNQSSVEYGLKCSVATTVNKIYTIRFRYAAHRINRVNVIVRNGGGEWHTNKYIDFPYTYSGGSGSEAGWGTFTRTFRVNNTSHVLNFVITDAANNGFFWIAKSIVFEGILDSPYSPHPSEVY